MKKEILISITVLVFAFIACTNQKKAALSSNITIDTTKSYRIIAMSVYPDNDTATQPRAYWIQVGFPEHDTEMIISLQADSLTNQKCKDLCGGDFVSKGVRFLFQRGSEVGCLLYQDGSELIVAPIKLPELLWYKK